MTRSLMMLVFGTLVVGCGYNEDTFGEDYIDAWCEKSTECEADIITFYTDSGLDEATAQTTFDTAYDLVCNAEVEESEDDGEDDCDFDKAAAADCIDGIKDASCEVSATGYTIPDACNNVCG